MFSKNTVVQKLLMPYIYIAAELKNKYEKLWKYFSDLTGSL